MAGKPVPTEAKKKHNSLCIRLDGLITADSFESMKRMAMTYVDRKLVEKADSMNTLLGLLEVKGVLAVGKYDILIELMKDASIGIGIDDIIQTNNDIQNILQSSIHRQARVKKMKEKAVHAKKNVSVKPSANKRKSKGKAPIKGTVATKKSVSQDPNTTRVKKTKEKAVYAKHKISVKPSPNKRKSKGKAPMKGTVAKKKSVSQDPGTNSYETKVTCFSTPKAQQKETHQRIASLTPSLTSWEIQARVTFKGEIASKRKKNNAGRYNTTRYFHFKVADESGEIEGVAFNDAVDKFYSVLKMGKVFYISGATLEEANRKYNSTMHDYHIVINKDTCIKPCQDTGDISPYGEFNFTTIDKLKDSRQGELVDTIAVVKECGQSETVKTKKGKNTVKREIQLVDQSGMQVGLTIWGSEAEKFSDRGNSILALKGVMVSEWGGRSLTMGRNGQIFVNPNIPKAEELRLWFISKGKQMDFTSLR